MFDIGVGLFDCLGYPRRGLGSNFCYELQPYFTFKMGLLIPCMQSHYREVLRWEIFMEQELRFGLDLGQMANFPAFIASKSFDL